MTRFIVGNDGVLNHSTGTLFSPSNYSVSDSTLTGTPNELERSRAVKRKKSEETSEPDSDERRQLSKSRIRKLPPTPEEEARTQKYPTTLDWNAEVEETYPIEGQESLKSR